MMDEMTFLRQLGYSGTLAEMRAQNTADVTGFDTVFEKLRKSWDEATARSVLGITSAGGSLVSVPTELSATGTPDATTALFGDGSWKVPAVGSSDADHIAGSGATGVSILKAATVLAVQAILGYLTSADKNVNNGILGLDGTGLVPDARISNTFATKQDVTDAVTTVVQTPPDLSSYATIAMLSGFMKVVIWNGTQWGPREATNNSIFFLGGPAQPNPDGSTSGGGGMVPGKDFWAGVVFTG